MQKLILLIALLTNFFYSNATGIAIYITNHTNQSLGNVQIDNRSLGMDVDNRDYSSDSIKINESTEVYGRSNPGRGIEGTLTLHTMDGISAITINFDNPYVGKSSYSAIAERPYHAKITSINRNGEPQSIYIEISGGIVHEAPSATPPVNSQQVHSSVRTSVAPPALKTITGSGNNEINGFITWNEDETGNPASTDWLNIFQFKCKVPLQFSPDDASKDTYKGRKGDFEGEQNSGQLLLGNYEVKGKIHTLNFILSGIANDVPLVIFDVQVKEAAAWQHPLKNPPPAATGYQYKVVTEIINTPVQNGNKYHVEYNLFGGWAGNKTDGGNGVGIDGKIKSLKLKNAVPSNIFLKNISIGNKYSPK